MKSCIFARTYIHPQRGEVLKDYTYYEDILLYAAPKDGRNWFLMRESGAFPESKFVLTLRMNFVVKSHYFCFVQIGKGYACMEEANAHGYALVNINTLIKTMGIDFPGELFANAILNHPSLQGCGFVRPLKKDMSWKYPALGNGAGIIVNAFTSTNSCVTNGREEDEDEEEEAAVEIPAVTNPKQEATDLQQLSLFNATANTSTEAPVTSVVASNSSAAVDCVQP